MADTPNVLDEEEQKRIALDLVLGAWEQALAKGVTPEAVATVCIFAALTDMVDLYGADEVAEMVRDLPDRVARGEFSLAEA